MPRALAAAAAPACSGSHNAVPQARGMTATAVGSRLHAERVISRTAENVIPDPPRNQLLAFFRISNEGPRDGPRARTHHSTPSIHRKILDTACRLAPS